MSLKSQRKTLRLLKISAIACVSALGVAVGALYIDGARSDIQRANFAIVYGNQVYPNGEPSPRLKARLDKALQLFETGQVTNLLVSGGVGKEGHDEAAVMAQYLQAAGVPKNRIVVDSQGNNSHLTAVNSAELLGTEKSVIAVSQLFHLSRAKLSLRNAGFESVGSAYPVFVEGRDVYSTFREIPAWLKYWVRND
ncbi:MAG: YdcF family protein [Limnothrix sp. RL_2_0]|nr:YdcF family protein [Limnothrix sp. RL_2_0]